MTSIIIGLLIGALASVIFYLLYHRQVEKHLRAVADELQKAERAACRAIEEKAALNREHKALLRDYGELAKDRDKVIRKEVEEAIAKLDSAVASRDKEIEYLNSILADERQRGNEDREFYQNKIEVLEEELYIAQCSLKMAEEKK